MSLINMIVALCIAMFFSQFLEYVGMEPFILYFVLLIWINTLDE